MLEGSHAIQRATGPGSVFEKKNVVDLVTEYDVKVEELVRNESRARMSAFSLVAYSFRHPVQGVLNLCLLFSPP
jgi:hypothetical protein